MKQIFFVIFLGFLSLNFSLRAFAQSNSSAVSAIKPSSGACLTAWTKYNKFSNSFSDFFNKYCLLGSPFHYCTDLYKAVGQAMDEACNRCKDDKDISLMCATPSSVPMHMEYKDDVKKPSEYLCTSEWTELSQLHKVVDGFMSQYCTPSTLTSYCDTLTEALKTANDKICNECKTVITSTSIQKTLTKSCSK
jgi:hypothetical protein